MPWYFPWSDSIKKRACRYLLQHYLGHFLKEKLTLDQLSVDLYNGTGTIKDVQLDVASLNEALDNFSVPVEIVDGYIGSITVSIPWSALISDNTVVEIHKLELTIQPRQRADSAAVMLDSMFGSMYSSIQLAEECLKQEPTEGEQQADAAQPFEGLEKFAQTIEAVLSNIKMSFVDTTVRLEHLPKEAATGAGLEVRIARVEYFDDQACEAGSSVDRPDQIPKNLIYEPAAIAHKNFHLMGVSMYCDEFVSSPRNVDARFHSPNSPLSPNLLSSNLSPPTSIYTSAIADQSPTDSVRGPDHGSPSPPAKDSDPVKVAVLMGKQEVKLKLKQNDQLPGPKLDLSGQFGSVNVHLSPRQLHLLLEIANGLMAPDVGSGSGGEARKATSKPMEPEDYEKVEHELQKQLQSGRLQQPPGRLRVWSEEEEGMWSHPIDDSDEEAYYDLGSHSDPSSMESSVSSTVTSRSTSTTSSSQMGFMSGQQRWDSPFQSTIPRAARVRPKTKHKDSLHKFLDDPSADLTQFKVKVSFLSVMLLHEDPPQTPSDALDPGQSSVDKLRDMANKYFGRITGISTSGLASDLVKLRDEFSTACPVDHISVLCKPVTLECSQKSSAALQSVEGDITVGLAEVVEAVFDRRGATASIFGFHLPIENILPEYCELLTFIQDDADLRTKPSQMFSSMHSASTPCIKVEIKVNTFEKHQPSRRASSHQPKTEVHVRLAKHRTEVDMTIVDRIHSLLSPQPLQQNSASAQFKPGINLMPEPQQLYFSQAIDEGQSRSDRQLHLRMSSQLSCLIIRFPVPDQGVSKPWWRRHLREESLILELSESDLQTSFTSGEPLSRLEFTCREGNGSFQLSPHDAPVSFIKLTRADETGSSLDEGFDWPRMVMKLSPHRHSVLEEATEAEEESLTPHDSLNGACQFSKPPPSPFSSKNVMYENVMYENEEQVVMPADQQEMAEFKDKASANSRCVLDLSLPSIHVFFPSKDFFELLYNRLVNDMVLWEPSAPAPMDVKDPNSIADWSTHLVPQMMQRDAASQMFTQCKSGVLYESDDSSEDDEQTATFHSISETRRKAKKKQAAAEQRRQRSKMAVNVSLNRARLTAFTSIKEEAGSLSMDQRGEFVLDAEDGSFFVVLNYNGDPELQYMCVQAHKATLYHKGCVYSASERPAVDLACLGQPTHLQPTIYLSDPGVLTRLSGQVGRGPDSSQDMLSVAVRIKGDQGSMLNHKDYRVALGVRGATLQHRATASEHSWFNQLLDFFDVKDYPIPGYTIPKVVTELHTYLWSCAVDYRPLYLPHRALVVMETFSISSNIIADSATSLLRFRVDDAGLYLSDQINTAEVDLKRNYVCVIDVGLFELSLRCSDGKDEKYPKMDLQASNNIVHIRTCSDSCRALGELINYLATDGDLNDPDPAFVKAHTTTQKMRVASGSSGSLAESPSLTQSNIEQVHDMMADAMLESPSSSKNSSSAEGSPTKGHQAETEVFFFPDEKLPSGAPVAMATDPMMASSSSMQSSTASQVSTSDADSGSLVSSPEFRSPRKQRSKPSRAGGLAMRFNRMAESVTSSMASDEETDPYSADEEFCIIDDPGLGISPKDGVPGIRTLVEEPIAIQDNHFHKPMGKVDLLRAPGHFPTAMYRYTLREMSLVWYMYGGADFNSTPKRKNSSPKPRTVRVTKPVHGQCVVDRSQPGKIAWQARGGPGRDIDVLMELQLNKVRLQHEIYPETTAQASRQVALISEVEIRDRLVSSSINKFLYQYTSDSVPKQSHANMVMIKAIHMRPDTLRTDQECSLRVSIQPLRLNIDQDALFFMKSFCAELAAESAEPEPTMPEGGIAFGTPPSSEPSITRVHSSSSSFGGKSPAPPPVMMVGKDAEHKQPDQQDMLLMFDEIEDAIEGETHAGEDSEIIDGEMLGGDAEEEAEDCSPKSQPVFFKSFIFSPDVPIRLDYSGKRVDMEQGRLAGLLVGLAQLNCSELTLKRIHHRHGLLGYDKLAMFTLNEWLKDIKKNQLPSILGGVGPMYSLVQLVQGVRDLFWLPVEQYRRDGRIVRGLQRGTQSFMTCTAMSALELTNRVVQTVQVCAEVAYDMVSPGPSVRKKKKKQMRQRRLTHPADLREGVTNAYTVVKEGIKGTAETIYNTAVEEHEQKGMSGAVGGVLRQIPPTIIQPVIIASEATSKVLGGMRNQLLPDKKKEDDDKWKPEDECD